MEYALVGNIEYKRWNRNLRRHLDSVVYKGKSPLKKNGFCAVAFLSFVCCYKH